MPKTSSPITFFGSGPVAAESLRQLAPYFTFEAVITKPKPEHHHDAFPVLEVAGSLGIPMFTPNSTQELTELFRKLSLDSEIGLVIDFGFIIEKPVIDYFPLGIVNSHFSLLPRLRGADPISFAILTDQHQTGVSLMLINEKLDEGQLLSQEHISIPPGSTTPSLTQKLIETSTTLLKRTLPRYMERRLSAYPQDLTEGVTYTRKLTKEDGRLDFTKTANALEREIRAFADWPKSYTDISGLPVVITESHLSAENGEPGKVTVDNKKLKIYCGAGALVIDRLKPAGKAEMTAAAFLAGYKTRLGL
jgi:methionyl-tRNA formyltransferase